MQGHLKLWDLRSDKQTAKATLLSPDQVTLHHLCSHPNQSHVVAASGDDGALAMWDMRGTMQPMAIISAHNGSSNIVSTVIFLIC